MLPGFPAACCSDVRDAPLPGKSKKQPQVRLKIALHARGEGREWGQGSACHSDSFPREAGPCLPELCLFPGWKSQRERGIRSLSDFPVQQEVSSQLGEGSRIKVASWWRKGDSPSLASGWVHSVAKSPSPHSHCSCGKGSDSTEVGSAKPLQMPRSLQG